MGHVTSPPPSPPSGAEKVPDYEKILEIWKKSKNPAAPIMRTIYAESVRLSRKGAVESGYKDLSEAWISEFQDEQFETNYDSLYSQIRPLFEQLHAYVRRKGTNMYGKKYPQCHHEKLIPAHLLPMLKGDHLLPYPNVAHKNITKILHERNFTVHAMFKQAEDFFVSIGMFPMTSTFWKYSMLEKPAHREALCEPPAAYDFHNKFDFRFECIKISLNIEVG
jgi:peptidyl-dipeptidase A